MTGMNIIYMVSWNFVDGDMEILNAYSWEVVLMKALFL